MKNPRPIPRLRLVAAGCGGAVQVGTNRVVIRLPDPRVIRLAVRLALLAIAVVSFPWLRSAVLRRSAGDAPVAAAQGFGRLLPTLVNDLRHRGLLRRKDKVMFHHEAASGTPATVVPDGSANFVFSAAASGGRSFDEIDRMLTINGVAAIRLSSDSSESFVPPANYRMTYIRRMGAATVVAMRKFAPAIGGLSGRRLLSVPKTKKEALDELEDVQLEPPSTKRSSWRRSRKTRYLPELIGDSLDGYSRRLFVEVVPAGRVPKARRGAAAWFDRHYPKNDHAFEFVQLVEMAAKDAKQSGSLLPSSSSSSQPSPTPSSSSSEMGMAEWLERNVKEEEYVVVKAEAEAVEEMVAKGAVRLVDELFLECDHQWERKRKSRRPYWQCLELYGKLRDQGVAVHQWWGSFDARH